MNVEKFKQLLRTWCDELNLFEITDELELIMCHDKLSEFTDCFDEWNRLHILCTIHDSEVCIDLKQFFISKEEQENLITFYKTIV